MLLCFCLRSPQHQFQHHQHAIVTFAYLYAMGRSQTATLPLIPLPRGTVLLPGLAYRVTVNSSRPDLPALLAYVYELAASKGPDGRIDSIPIACVPVSSPLVGPDGQLLIANGEDPESARIDLVNPGTAKKDDLFGFGVAAKIVGIDGRGSGEFALRVEGTCRIRVDAIVRERPFFEAKATYYEDEGKLSHTLVMSLHSNSLVCPSLEL